MADYKGAYKRAFAASLSTTTLIALLVLDVLADKPDGSFGTAISRAVEDRLGRVRTVSNGTLYPLLHRFEEEGLVSSEWYVGSDSPSDHPVRIYKLTPAGRAALAERKKALKVEFDKAIRFWQFAARSLYGDAETSN